MIYAVRRDFDKPLVEQHYDCDIAESIVAISTKSWEYRHDTSRPRLTNHLKILQRVGEIRLNTMYRKRNGSLGFSFTDFAQNAVPSLTMSRPQNTWVPSVGRDMLYAHQIAAKHPEAPFALDERSLFVGGICDSEGTSRRVFHKLCRAGILDEQGCVNTTKIEGKKFPHQVTLLSQPRQRDLVDLLFWWEEECQRLRKLFDEKKAVSEHIGRLSSPEGDVDQDLSEDSALDDGERAQLLDHLKFEREKLRMRMRQSPSQRRADIESGTDQLLTQINTVSSEPSRNQSTRLSFSSTQNDKSADPPMYYA